MKANASNWRHRWRQMPSIEGRGEGKCLQLKGEACRFWGITCRFLPYFSCFWCFLGYAMSFFDITLCMIFLLLYCHLCFLLLPLYPCSNTHFVIKYRLLTSSVYVIFGVSYVVFGHILAVFDAFWVCHVFFLSDDFWCLIIYEDYICKVGVLKWCWIGGIQKGAGLVIVLGKMDTVPYN